MMTIKKLLEKLSSLLKNPPDDDVLKEFRRKLSLWRLKPDQIDRLFDFVIDHHTFFPTIAEISQDIQELGRERSKAQQNQHWLTWKRDGKPFAMRCSDPSNPPTAPADATDVHLVVADAVEYEPCSVEEGRAAFALAYHQAGGNLQELKRYYDMAVAEDNRRQAKRARL
jgi:hypothetical protein